MNERPEADCPVCGLPVEEGSRPTTRDGVLYCCEGCASGKDCTCPQHVHSQA